jgi:hypothetical protein
MRRFPFRRSPQAPPSALGSAWDRRAKKWAEPAEISILGARLGGFFGAGGKKHALGGHSVRSVYSVYMVRFIRFFGLYGINTSVNMV